MAINRSGELQSWPSHRLQVSWRAWKLKLAGMRKHPLDVRLV